jgi:hypothetical protein
VRDAGAVENAVENWRMGLKAGVSARAKKLVPFAPEYRKFPNNEIDDEGHSCDLESGARCFGFVFSLIVRIKRRCVGDAVEFTPDHDRTGRPRAITFG